MKTIKTIPKVNKKPRESRIPRNLSGELDIKLEKPKLEKKEKQEGKKINQANRVKEKISSLFDTPVKELAPRNLVNFNETFCLTQDGEIPILQFENSETSSNQSVINIKETSTPVSEFQIFKTNLPSVERSSSLPTVSTQLQVNITSSVSGKNIDREQKASNNQSSDNHQKTSSAEGTSKVRNSLEQQCFQDVINSGQVVVANENLGYGNTSDMCNISLDLLNTHLGDYRAEDYPNLTAHSENRDISNLLLTPENISKQKVQIKDDSIKSLNLKNILEKTDETIHNSKYEKLMIVRRMRPLKVLIIQMIQ
ncbi:hypothetical protein HHI36_004705 [Cryptolaemus montrouzieri]|uniref:Uncharacterized protein n=1 Tax=Cryptolaemus montrouzieri TaxID=559131 RepID=A0ABD2NSE1_9CUCU